jgi:hypothetical protein
MDTVFSILQLIIPVVTFAMGYFLTNIGYKRERKLAIIREKFEKLYHPFYIMINELGTSRAEGFALGGEDYSTLKPFIDHLVANAYLASSEGQMLIWETRSLYVSFGADGNTPDKEKERLIDESCSALFQHLLEQYVKFAKVLGYEFGESEIYAKREE